jgi:transposase-like protein
MDQAWYQGGATGQNALPQTVPPGTGSVACQTLTSDFAGRHGCVASCSSTEVYPCRQEKTMTLPLMRCPYCHGKRIEAQRPYPIQCGEPRPLSHCAPCARSFSETRHTPLAQLKTPLALVVQVLAALTEGGGINAAPRLYGVSKKSLYRWQARLSGVKKHCCCSHEPTSVCHSSLKEMRCTQGSRSMLLPTNHQDGRWC